jgi:hypothetical protein
MLHFYDNMSVHSSIRRDDLLAIDWKFFKAVIVGCSFFLRLFLPYQ